MRGPKKKKQTNNEMSTNHVKFLVKRGCKKIKIKKKFSTIRPLASEILIFQIIERITMQLKTIPIVNKTEAMG